MLKIPVVVLLNADSMVDFGDIQEKFFSILNFELDGSYLRRRGVARSVLQESFETVLNHKSLRVASAKSFEELGALVPHGRCVRF